MHMITLSLPHLSLIPSSSTSETDGQFSSPQRVPPLWDPLLVRPLLVLLSQYLPSRVSAPIRYGWYTVAGDGAPRSLSVVRSSGTGLALFRSLTVPLLGSVPSRCRCFTLSALFAWFLWLLVVSCGTGWASTSIDNL